MAAKASIRDVAVLGRISVIENEYPGPGLADTNELGADDSIAVRSFTEGTDQQTEDAQDAGPGIGQGKRMRGPVIERPSVNVSLRGWGSAVVPDYDPLLKCGGFAGGVETAIPASGTTTADAGTTSSVDIDTTAEGNEDWDGLQEKDLVGRRVTFSGNPVTPATRTIKSWADQGSGVFRLTWFEDAFGSALSGATEVKVEPDVRYYTHSNLSIIPDMNLAMYRAGKIRRRIFGARTNPSFTLRSARTCFANFGIVGSSKSLDQSNIPTGIVAPPKDPQQLKKVSGFGAFLIDGVAVQVGQITINCNTNPVLDPDQCGDPNSESGMTAAALGIRDIQITADLLAEFPNTRNLFEDMREGSEHSFFVAWGTGAYERQLFAIPKFEVLSHQFTEKGPLLGEQVTLGCTLRDHELFYNTF